MQGDAPTPSDLPAIALTLGDINGIGPEVVVRAVLDERVQKVCRPLLIGPRAVLDQATGRFGTPPAIECVEPEGLPATEVTPGQVTAAAGRIAHDCLRFAARAAGAGEVDAVCTGPLNKAALAAAGIRHPGHTEILADECGVSDFAMMLHLSADALVDIRQLLGAGPADRGVAIAHATLHSSVRSVPGLLSPTAVLEKIGLVAGFLRRLGIAQPRIGVAALNPHAGESGLFGDEESTQIAPGIEQAQAAGVDARGPFPADTLIRRAILGEFDGLVAMYHDQGHIPVKLIAFDRAINVTLGIPMVRTSPTHGTAFDIAWQGRANPAGMIEAILLAARLSRPHRDQDSVVQRG